MKARLTFVEKYEINSDVFWAKVTWSDETKIELFGRNTSNHVWRKKETAYQPNNTIPMVKFACSTVLLWGCFASNGVGEMEIIEGKMNALKYQNILFRNLLRRAITLQLESKFTFQQDNDPKHKTKSTQKWFQDNSIDVLEWLSQ